jgi:hypothetical protein
MIPELETERTWLRPVRLPSLRLRETRRNRRGGQ